MTTTIALAGKGGVGKTTIAGMVIKYLAQNQTGSILAIDADPSSNLNMVLGLDLEWTVGDIREDMLAQVKSSGRHKQTRVSRLSHPLLPCRRLTLRFDRHGTRRRAGMLLRGQP
jgi:CO dehydrogenase nickel-insertion accessory protein CooC1